MNFLRTLVIVSVCGVVSAAPAEHLLAFKAYRDALEAGQLDAARDHAERAWQFADKEKVAAETRAILAHNFAEITVLEDAKRALPALKDAVALAEQGYGLANYSLVELQLYLAYGEAKRRPSRLKRRRALIDAIDAYRASGGGLNELVIRMFFNAASMSYDYSDYDAAEDISRILSHDLEALDPVPAKLLAATNIMRVAAMLSGEKFESGSSELTEEYIAKVQDAQILIDYTLTVLPTPTSIAIGSYDELYAQAAAWRVAVKSVQASFDIEMDYQRIFEGKQSEEGLVSYIDRRDEHGERISCEADWLYKAVVYPMDSLRRGKIGAILIAYHISEDGHIEGARVLAEVPAKEFSRSVLRQTKKWRLDMSTLNDPRCLKDSVSGVSFAIQK